MQDEKNPKEEPGQGHEMLDEEAEKQLAGVPEHLRDQSDDDAEDEAGEIGRASCRERV